MADHGRPGPRRPGPRAAGLLADLPPEFDVDAVDFTVEPFARLTYAYPGRRPARLALAGLPAPMRAELLFWLRSLDLGGERVNSWALAEWMRVAGRLSTGPDAVGSFVELSVEQWLAAARRRYHDRHQRMPPASYLHNHWATIGRLHATLTRAYQTGEWWRAEVWDPCHDPRIPLREHEPLRTAPAAVRPGRAGLAAPGHPVVLRGEPGHRRAVLDLAARLPDLPESPLRTVPDRGRRR